MKYFVNNKPATQSKCCANSHQRPSAICCLTPRLVKPQCQV